MHSNVMLTKLFDVTLKADSTALVASCRIDDRRRFLLGLVTLLVGLPTPSEVI